ncbi:uncharacterized protein Tco025E_02626 [Trypanosoma conorhini]|uniref:Uncharacterized protein n=1 Tax=Trypanosoma conorhini TaxID=83891 RepID=A0A3R7LA92_9TRYP|nr:uncharacterized protein Tco025E_02626 [Trypanosoma conorhini]RNF24267.1 hypothetical protein Tco025E_02626 [Trypanosoma conorhini]
MLTGGARQGTSPAPVEKKETDAVERDENDIGLHPAPIALVLRHQCAAEALSAVKEEEIVGRLNLLHSCHNAFLAIVRQSLYTLHLDSVALSRAQAQQQLRPGLGRTPVKRNSDRRAGDRARSRTGRRHAAESSGLDVEREYNEEPSTGFQHRLRVNNFRRMNEELIKRQRQVEAFAAHEMRRREAARRLEEFLHARSIGGDCKPSITPNTTVREMRERQRAARSKAQQYTARARQSRLQELQKRRYRQLAAEGERLQLLLKERRIRFEREMKNLEEAAECIHEMYHTGCLGDHASMASLAPSLQTLFPAASSQASMPRCNTRAKQPITEADYGRLCGLREAAMRSVVAGSLAPPPAAPVPEKDITRKYQQPPSHPILWH